MIKIIKNVTCVLKIEEYNCFQYYKMPNGIYLYKTMKNCDVINSYVCVYIYMHKNHVGMGHSEQ